MTRFGLVLSATLVCHPAAFGCSVPVFRYALERWQPSKYDLIVYHKGPLSPADRDTVALLKATARRANIRLRHADLAADTDAGLRAIWKRDGKDAPLPRLVLRYPDSTPQTPSAWTGPLSGGHDGLFDSPALRAVYDHLTAGHAAVVLLLRSGDPAADRAAREFLTAELRRIAAGIELPAPSDDGPQVQSELPLRINFPVVEVNRTPKEDVLVRILLGSEDGLADANGPIAFPVFGRGRALCSLHGKDLMDPAELRRSLEFLCKACSCQVKELNPGIDLLISANWDSVFDVVRGPSPRTGGEPGPVAGQRHRTSDSPETAAGLRSPPPAGYSLAELVSPSDRPTRRPPLLRLGTVATGVLVLATGYWASRSRRTPPPEQ